MSRCTYSVRGTWHFHFPPLCLHTELAVCEAWRAAVLMMDKNEDVMDYWWSIEERFTSHCSTCDCSAAWPKSGIIMEQKKELKLHQMLMCARCWKVFFWLLNRSGKALHGDVSGLYARTGVIVSSPNQRILPWHVFRVWAILIAAVCASASNCGCWAENKGVKWDYEFWNIMICLTVSTWHIHYFSQVCWKGWTRTTFIPALLPSLPPLPNNQYYAVQLSKVRIYLFLASKLAEEHQNNWSTSLCKLSFCAEQFMW